MISLALPDGSLMREDRGGRTARLLSKSGLVVCGYTNESKASPEVDPDCYDGLDLTIIRPSEALRRILTDGGLAITGGDLILENLLNPSINIDSKAEERLEHLCNLDYGKVALVSAVKKSYRVTNFEEFLHKIRRHDLNSNQKTDLGGISEYPYSAAKFVHESILSDEVLRTHFGSREPVIVLANGPVYTESRNPRLVIIESKGKTEEKVKKGRFGGYDIHWGYEVRQSGDTMEAHELIELTANNGILESEAGLYGDSSFGKDGENERYGNFVRDMLLAARDLKKELEPSSYVPITFKVKTDKLDLLMEHFKERSFVYSGEISSTFAGNGHNDVSLEILASKRWQELSNLYEDHGVSDFRYSNGVADVAA